MQDVNNMNKTLSLTLSTVVMSFLFSACGGGSGESVDNSNDNENSTPPINIELKAFNQFDASTFSASTCTNLPIEIASGIFVSVNGSSTATGTKQILLTFKLLSLALHLQKPVIQSGFRQVCIKEVLNLK